VDVFTAIELLELVFAVGVVVASAYALADAVGTVKHVAEARVANGRRTVAIGQVVAEFLRLLMGILLACTAAVSYLLPSPPMTMHEENLTLLTMRKSLLLAVTALVLFGTLWDLHVRFLLRRRS
jgi:hypothetical protein